MKITDLIKITLVLIVFSCNTEQKTQEKPKIETITVPIDYEKHLLTDSLIKEFKIIPLETNDSCLISRIEQIIVYNNNYYIQDMQSKSIFVFDSNGKFMFKINAWGRGPGEYIQLSDFKIDNNGNILILDYMQIIKYNQKGEYLSTNNYNKLKTEKNLFNPIQFAPLGDGGYYFWKGSFGINNNKNLDNYALYRVNKGSELIKRELNLKRQHIGFWNVFYKRKGESYFMQSIEGNDTIYSVSEKGIIPVYDVDFGARSFPGNYLPKGFIGMGKKYYDIYNSTDYSRKIHNIAENNNLLYFSFHSRNSTHTGTGTYEVLYSKKSKHVKVGKLIYNSCPTSVGIYTCNQKTNEFISIMSDMAVSLLIAEREKHEKDFNEIDKWIIRYLDSTKKKFNNPFLITYKIKDF